MTEVVAELLIQVDKLSSWASTGNGRRVEVSELAMSLLRNRRRRIWFSLLSGDPYTPSRELSAISHQHRQRS
jgi:hypothetical protein